jgi:hypothetical protein
MYPKERITEDFDALADRLLGTPKPGPAVVKSGFRLFNRQKEPAHA